MVWGILLHHTVSFLLGMMAGGAAVMVLFVRDTAPRYVQTWGDGAEGEAQTHMALEGAEGVLLDDIDKRCDGGDVPRGNYDHVFASPRGVFLLETKNLQGIVEIRDGVPRLRRRHDPEADSVLRDLRPRALSNAAAVSAELRRRTARRPWVSAVVVFWAEFPEGVVDSDPKIAYVHGPRLREWLESKPAPAWPVPVDHIAAALRDMKREGEARASAAQSESPLFSPPLA
jgi:hypothetical protein